MLRFLAVLCIAGAPAAHAQAFEVASIKPNHSVNMRQISMESLPGGRFVATNVTPQMLIATAYDVPFQGKRLTGGPDWATGDRYDIEATAEKGAMPASLSAVEREERLRTMLQKLLADRFKLQIRSENKDLPVYALGIGKGGPKLEKSKVDEKDCSDDPKAAAANQCHNFNGGQGRGLHGSAVATEDLVLFIANWTDRPVVDRTGLKGLYSIQTEGWTPFQAPIPGTGGGEESLSDPTRPTLFLVLNRLGLKLEPSRAPIAMYTIEHIEKPAAN